jgi:hypothetical protein
LYEAITPGPSPTLPGLFLKQCDIPKSTKGRGPGFLLRHAAGDVFCRLLVYVELHFIFELFCRNGTASDRPHPEEQSLHPPEILHLFALYNQVIAPRGDQIDLS